MRSVPFRGNNRIYYYLHVSMHVFIETHVKLIVDWRARAYVGKSAERAAAIER